MITHLLFKGLNSFNIGSSMFRKILSVIIAVLIFALVFLAVKFTKVEVPNFNRNLIMLAVVYISAFGLVMWKFGCPTEKMCEEEKEKEKVESFFKEEAVKEEEGEKEIASNKTKDEADKIREDSREDSREKEGKNTKEDLEDVENVEKNDELDEVDEVEEVEEVEDESK